MAVTGLNPLSIGSVFPTYLKYGECRVIGLNPLSIGSVFPTEMNKDKLWVKAS